jgi:putative ABC transport system substrate-binding protein
MHNKIIRLLAVILFAPATLTEAQQAGKIARVGFVQARVAPAVTTSDPLADAFRRGLTELGYVEGKNIVIEHRYAEGIASRIPVLVAELVQLKVDVLVAPSISAIRAAKQETTTIPIVMVGTFDPVATGIVNSFAYPGGNITGLTRLTRDLSGKRLELLKEAVQGISRVGVIEDGGRHTNTAFKDYEIAARTLKLTIQSLAVRSPQPDFEGAFQSAAKDRVNALITVRDALTAGNLKRIADLAIKNRLPSMNEDGPYVEAGGLMSYSANDPEQFRRAAYYVDRILKGTKPADLPIEQPKKFEFIINLKTAKQIGVTIPQSVLFRADKVFK